MSTSAKRSAPLANSTNASKKSKTAAATKDSKKTPHDIYFDAQKAFLNEHKEILGSMLIKGLPEKPNSKYTEKQMNSLRFIMVTKNRNEQLDEMAALILGEQANDSFLMFNTSFSYGVLDSWDVVKRQLARKTPAQKLDILIAYTFHLHQYDTWMLDNEGGMDVLVKGLASTWKKLIKDNSDDALGWDLEYTKPGVMALLQEFKKEIASADSCDSSYGLGKFNYK